MPRVHVQLPSLLTPIVGSHLSFDIEADSLDQALHFLREHHPALGLHLFDETHKFRPHVLCFHNGRNTRWLNSLEVPLRDGDTLQFMQAVTGG
jgi:molybdopterin converting factor small subunit